MDNFGHVFGTAWLKHWRPAVTMLVPAAVIVVLGVRGVVAHLALRDFLHAAGQIADVVLRRIESTASVFIAITARVRHATTASGG